MRVIALLAFVGADAAAFIVMLMQVRRRYGGEGTRAFAAGAVVSSPPLLTPVVLGIPATFIAATAAILLMTVFWAGRGDAARVFALDPQDKSAETREAQRRLAIAIAVGGTVWGVVGGILFL